ncbi:pyrroline-5-carboxylate reductase [Olivibacter sp. SDN3]|uniref:pyrroline-5-carboxylate reductase n=1 Tax=Olivibacter sp. SDN3 TaxID=2764720 RepID=UPI0016512AEC|nr:pyrroline-5-carboxylate reductase [Olivibacter sp. SDN3]QNL49205.1 pyrroline-5-carboxylate reductase [Olivibacter sp. SDN3]
MKVLVIGGGNMGLTYAEAIAKSNFLNNGDLMIFDKSETKLDELRERKLFDVYDRLGDCLPQADVVFLAVKPVHSAELMQQMNPLVSNEQLFISIMAGVTIEAMKNGLGITKVVRAMPNLPALVGLGMTSFTAAAEVSRLELATVENLLDTTGRSIGMESEQQIDASTGISGSGPAYVFYFMESMMEAALKMGFSTKDARLLVSQTFLGAIELFNSSDLNPDEWMRKVASKGGTTQAALESMEENHVKERIKDAAYAAFKRAAELGKEFAASSTAIG